MTCENRPSESPVFDYLSWTQVMIVDASRYECIQIPIPRTCIQFTHDCIRASDGASAKRGRQSDSSSESESDSSSEPESESESDPEASSDAELEPDSSSDSSSSEASSSDSLHSCDAHRLAIFFFEVVEFSPKALSRWLKKSLEDLHVRFFCATHVLFITTSAPCGVH
jgi:hypothetical protein